MRNKNEAMVHFTFLLTHNRISKEKWNLICTEIFNYYQ